MTRASKLLSSKPVVIAFAVALVGTLLWALSTRTGVVEPCYNGKPLSFWLRPYDLTVKRWDFAFADYDGASAAVSALGTNCLPFLVQLHARRPSELKRHANKLLAKQKLVTFRFAPEPDYPMMGFKALFFLQRSNRAAAAPLLIPLLAADDNYENGLAIDTLCQSLPYSAPAVLSALTNSNPRVSAGAADCLVATATGRLAVPTLKQLVRSGDRDRAVAAARVLATVWDPALQEIAMPVLMEGLSSKSRVTRARAADGLSSCEYKAKAAVPSLLALARETDPLVSGHAKRALLRIDRTVARQAGITE